MAVAALNPLASVALWWWDGDKRSREGGGNDFNGCHSNGEREENGEGVQCLVCGQLQEEEGGPVRVALMLGGLSTGIDPGAAVAHVACRAGRRGVGDLVGGGRHVGQPGVGPI
jgi:hypothetical protein